MKNEKRIVTWCSGIISFIYRVMSEKTYFFHNDCLLPGVQNTWLMETELHELLSECVDFKSSSGSNYSLKTSNSVMAVRSRGKT